LAGATKSGIEEISNKKALISMQHLFDCAEVAVSA